MPARLVVDPTKRDPTTAVVASVRMTRSRNEASTRSLAGIARRPWSQSWLAALPVSPISGGALLCLGHVVLGVTLVGLFGDFGAEPGRVLRLLRESGFATAVFGLLIGYAPAAMAASERAQLHALRELRPVLRVSSPGGFDDLERELQGFDMRELRIVGATAALVTVAILFLDPGVQRTRRIDDPVILWNLWQNVVAAWLCTRTMSRELRASRLFSRIGDRYTEVGLFDLRPVAPFARRGIQGALVAILMLSLFSLILLDRGAARVAPLIQALVILLGCVSLFLPMRGVHRRIAAKKREALSRVVERIGRAEAALVASSGGADAETATRLAALLTLRREIESAREWPLELSVLVRFGAVVAIGLLSSLGQMILERILGSYLS